MNRTKIPLQIEAPIRNYKIGGYMPSPGISPRQSEEDNRQLILIFGWFFAICICIVTLDPDSGKLWLLFGIFILSIVTCTAFVWKFINVLNKYTSKKTYTWLDDISTDKLEEPITDNDIELFMHYRLFKKIDKTKKFWDVYALKGPMKYGDIVSIRKMDHSLYSIGSYVSHKEYGVGEIVKSFMRHDKISLEVNFRYVYEMTFRNDAVDQLTPLFNVELVEILWEDGTYSKELPTNLKFINNSKERYEIV